MNVSPHPDQIAWEEALARSGGEDPLPHPAEKGDRDKYSFRGPVKRVEPIEEFLGQSGWLLRVAVMRNEDDSDHEIDLEIVVTKRIWQADTPPAAGQDIEGSLWLQGYLF
jgi:hypothetical protein